MKIVYLFNQLTGNFEGLYSAQESPLEPGVYIMPSASTEIAPPQLAPGENLLWNGTAWQVIAAPVPLPPPVLSEAETARNIANAIQAAMEIEAKDHGYDSLISACSYAAQAAGEPFQAEGAAFLKWRSAVWVKANIQMAEVQAGKRPMPTEAEALAAMPALMLPI